MKHLRILWVFVFLSLLTISCNDSDEQMLQPTAKKYKLKLSDNTLSNLLSEAKSTLNPNGRIAEIQYREDSAMVVENEDKVKYSIPIVAGTPGASENLILETDENGLQKATIYSVQPDDEWVNEHYNGVDTDYSTFLGRIELTDLSTGEVSGFTNMNMANGRDADEGCPYTIVTVEGTDIWYIWIDLAGCQRSGSGGNNGGTDGSTPGGDTSGPSYGDGGGGSSSGTSGDSGSGSDSDPVMIDPKSIDKKCPEGFKNDGTGKCVPVCPSGFGINNAGNCVSICDMGLIPDGNGECIPVNFDIDNSGEETNPCELTLIVRYPNAAWKINNNVGLAHNKTIEIFGSYINGNGHNDCADAFRHTYFNLLNTRDIGADLTRQFGEAHECDSDHEEETEMDLHNNEEGINLALFNPKVPIDNLIQVILSKLYNGELKILSNLSSTNEVTSQTQVISSTSCEN